jgi:hypothetical protein
MILATVMMFFQLSAPTATAVETPVVAEPTTTTNHTFAAEASKPELTIQSSSSKPADAIEMASLGTGPRLISLANMAANPDPVPIEPVKVMAPRREERQPVPVFNKRWVGLTFAQHAAATFDAWSTRRVVASGRGKEDNPLLSAASRSNALYPVIQITPVLCDYFGSRMQRSNNALMRRVWWMPQVVGTGMHLFGGFHNMSVYNSGARH